MKYKVGDRVRVISDEILSSRPERYKEWFYSDSRRLQMLGEVVTISSIDHPFYKLTEYPKDFWADNDFIAVPIPAPHQPLGGTLPDI